MILSEKYYGWKNHETFICNQWLHNDSEKCQQIRQYVENRTTLCPADEAENAVAGYIRALIRNNIPQLNASLYYAYFELLFDSLGHIDYNEIAREFINEQ